MFLDAKNSERKLGERRRCAVGSDPTCTCLSRHSELFQCSLSLLWANTYKLRGRTKWRRHQTVSTTQPVPLLDTEHLPGQSRQSRQRESNFSNRSVIFIIFIICVKAAAPSSRHVTTAERCESGEQPLRSINKFLSWSFQRETICMQAHVWHENCTKQHKAMCDLFFILACFFAVHFFFAWRTEVTVGLHYANQVFVHLGAH